MNFNGKISTWAFYSKKRKVTSPDHVSNIKSKIHKISLCEKAKIAVPEFSIKSKTKRFSKRSSPLSNGFQLLILKIYNE